MFDVRGRTERGVLGGGCVADASYTAARWRRLRSEKWNFCETGESGASILGRPRSHTHAPSRPRVTRLPPSRRQAAPDPSADASPVARLASRRLRACPRAVGRTYRQLSIVCELRMPHTAIVTLRVMVHAHQHVDSPWHSAEPIIDRRAFPLVIDVEAQREYAPAEDS